MKPRLAELLTIGALTVGVALWAGRLEARLDARVDAQAAEMAALKAAHREAIEQIREDLRYIRQRLDQVVDASR